MTYQMHKNNTQKQGTLHYNQTLIKNTTLYYFWGITPPTSITWFSTKRLKGPAKKGLATVESKITVPCKAIA